MMGEDRGARVERIPLGRVRPRGLPVRSEPSEAELARLAASIRKFGLLQPLLVRPAGRDYEVVCGQRRYLAAKRIGAGEIVAVVRTLDDRQALEVAVAENARRDALNGADRAALQARLAAAFPGRTPGEIEEWLGAAAAAEASAAAVPAPGAPAEGFADWLSTLPETESRPQAVSVVVAGDSGTKMESASPAEGAAHAPAVAVSPGLGGDTRVLVRPDLGPGDKVLIRPNLLAQVRDLLNRMAKSGKMDEALLDRILDELVRRIESTPPPEFLDLSYRGKSKRYVSRHCLNVAKLAMFLGRSLGMGPEEVRELAMCGLLHDIGMMRVKEEVFTKHAALDRDEWEQVKGHPVEGALLLTKEVVLRDVVARVALEHHEKPDGSGYPQGKKKSETHVYARIINVVDTYGAMVSPRAHRLPMLPFQAMRVVMDDGAKGMLDWELVQAFVKAMSMYPLGSYVKLEGGEIARVVRAQPELPDKPVIAVVADAQRNLLRTPVEIDLAMTEPMPNFEPIQSPI